MATYNLTAGNDVLAGTEGADTFDGVTGGTDTLDGAGGNDRFIFQDSLGPHSQGTVNGGAGVDTVVAGHLGSASYSNVEILDVKGMAGFEFANIFGSIAQLLSFATITSSAEPTSRIVFELSGAGGTIDFSTLLTTGHSITVADNHDRMTSGYAVTGTNLGDFLYGTAFDDTLNGGGGNDQLFSTTFHNGGVDTFNGGAGDDTLEVSDSTGVFNGGIGNDTFKISSSAGSVDGGTGTDTVVSDSLGAVSYSNVEILDATSGYIFASVAQFLSFATITNSAEPNSRIAFHLGGTGGVIDFSTLLTSAYSGYVSGQDLTSGVTVTGTTNNDTLEGSEFNDTINGGAGADAIHASGGTDALNGGAGNDVFYVFGEGGSGTVDAGTGTDTVTSYMFGLGTYAFTNVEVLDVEYGYIFASVAQLSSFESITMYKDSGTLNVGLTRNGGTFDFSTRLSGSDAVNLSDGGVTAGYNVTATANDDFLYGSGFNDVFQGGAGSDTIYGGGGIDTASYAKSVSGVTINLATNAHSGGDAQGDSLTGIENVIGSNFADTLTGNGSSNRLAGGLGNDAYYVDNTADSIVEAVGGGSDTVRSYINWTLVNNVERLELQGTGNLNGAGNTLNNTLVGNAGNNVLNGGAGNDYMVGGAGNDIFVVAAAGDRTVENASGGTDTVRSYINWTLGANVGRLELQGTSNLNGTGNTLNNTLVGNSGNNSLNGGSGNDYIVGGAGNDTLSGSSGNDRLIGGAGSDVLNGGTGNDVFDFDFVYDSPAGPALRDSILGGFSHGFDRIDLATIDANTLTGGNQAFSFIGSAAFSGVAGQLRYTNYSGNVIIDADLNGDSTADMQILVAGTNFMTGTDFIV